MSDDRKNWSARPAETPLGREVELTLTDGATVYLHPEIARELGKQLRMASDVCETGQSTLIG